jgi:hypothetical protein
MNELIYIDSGNPGTRRRIFAHGLFNSNKSGVFVIIFNHFLDRLSEFPLRNIVCETAKYLNAHDINTIHFDYYGTGDSAGELHELDFEETTSDVKTIIAHINTHYSPSRIIFMGARFGADIALQASRLIPGIDNIIMYEPIINGKYFFKSKYMILKSNHLLMGLNPEIEIDINGQIYTDFDGVPISEKCKSFINSIKTDELDVSGKNILLFNIDNSLKNISTDAISKKKHIEDFVEKQKVRNRLREVIIEVAPDWFQTRQIAPIIVKFIELVQAASPASSTIVSNVTN